eukprot:1720557-Amphidinium_carterae.1
MVLSLQKLSTQGREGRFIETFGLKEGVRGPASCFFPARPHLFRSLCTTLSFPAAENRILRVSMGEVHGEPPPSSHPKGCWTEVRVEAQEAGA